ncbi:MAG TPA: rhomboid family intramembrane serine protease [Bacteroidia bacterium]|jgi:membrane associated rhomboid family serine protease|nr:rhomboid family intramembrane serine protease [Bacteroidia bacterium]
MTNLGISGWALILSNILFSYQGLKDEGFFNKYSFEVDQILVRKEYRRLITSGFLHVSWTHLLFNMMSLYFFYGGLESSLGEWKALGIYLVSLVGGDLLALFIHRHHGDYSAVGASGAVSGIIFASIALFPGMSIGFFGLPFSIPSWAYGLLYVLYSIYGIKSKRDNIGHEAHLGGGLTGLLVAVILVPQVVQVNYIPIALILIPTTVFLFLIITKPHLLFVGSLFQTKKAYYDIDEKYNAEKREKELELDEILDKIHRKGINSLSRKEKEKLDRYSQ